MIEIVSLNQPIDTALQEQKRLEQRGYIVTGQYHDDFDMGLYYEKPEGNQARDILARHKEHMKFVELYNECRDQIFN